MKLRPVAVRWRDAYALGETWVPADHQYGAPVVVTTHGYLIDHDLGDDYTVIAGSTYLASDGTRFFGGITVVPTSMILSRRRR